MHVETNTVSETVSDTNQNELEALIKGWKTLVNSKKANLKDVIYYILLRPLIQSDLDFNRVALDQEVLEESDVVYEADFYLGRAFTPVSNIKKLANGRKAYDTPNRALAEIASRFSHPKVMAFVLDTDLSDIGEQNVRLLASLVTVE